ncbi:O-acetylhomoserine ami [Lactarius tabidus]
MTTNFYQEPAEFETLQVLAAQDVDPATKRTAYLKPDSPRSRRYDHRWQHGADLFGLRAVGNTYSRVGNPTVEVFEKRIAALEGGVAAVAAASGQAAQFMAVSTIAGTGDNIVSTPSLYVGLNTNTPGLLFKKFGIEVKFITSDEPEAFAAAIDGNTKAIFVESIGNSKYNVSPVNEIAKIAQDPADRRQYVRDGSTAQTSSCTVQPSGSVGGHGTTIAGVAIDSESSTGSPVASPHSPLPPSLETLSLRAQRHCDNAQFLEQHEKVAWVSYTGLESHVSHQLACKTLRNDAFGGMLNFGVKGGEDPAVGAKVVDSLRLASNLANVGDAKTLVIHPATQLTADEQLAAGVTPDLIRVSVGIEHIQDIIRDFEVSITLIQYKAPVRRASSHEQPVSEFALTEKRQLGQQCWEAAASRVHFIASGMRPVLREGSELQWRISAIRLLIHWPLSSRDR